MRPIRTVSAPSAYTLDTMNSSQSLRILLALVVAFWSPALCCCRIAQASHCSSNATERAIEGVHYDGQHEDRERDACHSEQSSSQQPCDRDEPGDTGCGCQSHVVQATLVAAEAVPSAHLFHSFCLLTSAVPTGLIEFDRAASEHRYRPADPALTEKVRAQSLYARHCLLLV